MSYKLTGGFFLVALLIWVVGYLAVTVSRKALQKSIGESSASLAAEILDEIDRDLYNKIERFQSFSDPSLLKAIIKSNQEFENLDDIQSYINDKDAEWTSVPKQETTPFMEDLINNELSKALRKRTRFYEKKYGFGVFPEVFVTNKYGANVGQTGKTSDYRQDDEQWWQRARRDGLYVRDVAYDESADVYSVDIGIRIDDEDGNFIGAAKVVLNIEEVINVIKEAEEAAIYESQELKLVTKECKTIYDSTEEYKFSEDMYHKEFVKRITEDTGYTLKKGEHGEETELLAYARSKGHKEFEGLDWILLVEHDTEEIFAPVAKLRSNILIVSLVVTISAIVLGLFISTSISKPITRLRDAATTIGQGNLDCKIGTGTKDEIGQLSRAFDKTTEYLKESHTNLEEKVQQRTAELSLTNAKLENQITQRTQAQGKLQQHIKHLNCLYGLSKLVERPKISLEQILQETAKLIRNTYQRPDLTCARITFEGIHHKTDNFKKTEVSQHTDIKVHGEKAGDVEIYYLGEKTESGQDPFLKEEWDLLNAIAEHLGRIAERHQAREKLQLFRDLIDRSNDCVFIKEPKWGRFLEVNEKACSSLGYTREELLNMAAKDIEQSIPDDASWAEHVKEVRKKGYMVLEGLHKRKDGSTFPVEVNVKLIEQEKNSYMVAVVRDITERKQAEDALQESEARYRSLTDDVLDSSAVGIFILDSDFKIVWVNQALERFFGLHREDVIGRDKRELIRKKFKHIFEDSESFVEKVFATYGNNTYIENFECHVLPGDQREERWLEHWSQPIRSGLYAGGRIEHYTDITERKQDERKQAELLKEVENINKELKDFAYIISHDLKAPLRGIKTLIDWISADYADKLDEQGIEQMNLLSGRADRMHNLIDGVLQYSRVGRVKEKTVQVNLNELVPAVIDMLAPPENIAITVENELPTVECEETRITQVFQNLLSNAVKYMDKPKGQIKVGCVEEPGFWKFSVADNGPGIEEKNFDTIFQMFRTLVPRDEFESTGVGLTVVKKIIELYGGKIWVEAKPGQGSTFFFTLPK